MLKKIQTAPEAQSGQYSRKDALMRSAATGGIRNTR
jgi:hypothetical protein